MNLILSLFRTAEQINVQELPRVEGQEPEQAEDQELKRAIALSRAEWDRTQIEKKRELSEATVYAYLTYHLGNATLDALQCQLDVLVSLQECINRGTITITTAEAQKAVRDTLNCVNSMLVFPQLPFDEDLVPENGDTVVNNVIVEKLAERKQETDKYLREFSEQTGLSPLNYGRVVVNVSGEENLCGMRAVLSQICLSYGDTALAHKLQGGRVDLAEENNFDVFYSRIFVLYLIIAVGHTRQYLSDVISAAGSGKVEKIGNIEDYLRSQMERLTGAAVADPERDSADGMLGAEDVRFLAQALNRPFVIVESNKNNIDMQNRNLGDTQTAIDVVTALLNQIFTLENEVLQQPATLKEMEDFLANFQRGFADGQLQLTAIAMAGDILAMIANNPNLAVEEIKNGLKKKRKDLEARAESIRDSLAGLRAGGATVRIYDHNGDTAIYHAVRANDPGSLSGGPGFPVQYKQDAIRSVLIDPRAVCLFNIGNHYMAIQRHIPV